MSTEPTIEMMNVVIAKFMGYYYQAGKFYSNTVYPGRGNWFKHAKYDTSWDWLMPVAEMLKDKLYGLWNDNQIQERPQMEISLNTNTIKLVDVETGWCLIDPISKDTLKETVYHACYEIIKWYNQQKQTDDERGTHKG